MLENMFLRSKLKPKDPSVYQWDKTTPESEFLAYVDLVALISPAVSYSKVAGFKYFQFTDQYGKKVLVPSHPIGRGTYVDLYLKGAVFGTDDAMTPPPGAVATPQNLSVVIGAETYRVRVVKGVPEGFTVSSGTVSDNPNWGALPYPEYEQFFPNIWTIPSNINSGIRYPDLGIPAGDKVAKTNPGGTSNSNMCTQGHAGSMTIGRGRFDTKYSDGSYVFKWVQYTSTVGVNNAFSTYWPVLEKI